MTKKIFYIVWLVLLTSCSNQVSSRLISEYHVINYETINSSAIGWRIKRFENKEVICYQSLEALQCKFK